MPDADSSAVLPSAPAPSPLQGIRVVDAANMVMVPSAAVVLADFGADVIKLEPLHGDLNRRGHLIPGMPTHPEQYCFLQDNRNKRSLAMDLKSPDTRPIFERLIETTDVFFTNTRHAALTRNGLDYDSLAAINPRLIFAHGTGYGNAGSECNKPGFDAVCYWSRSGLESSLFPIEGELGPPPYGSGDHPSGMTLVTAVLLALLQRDRTGKGSYVSTSLLANGAWSNSITIQARLLDATFPDRRPRHDPINFAVVYYRASCGRAFKFTIIDHNATWPRFCRAIDRTDMIEDPRYATVETRAERMGEIVEIADRAFATQDLDFWRRSFAENDIAFSAMPTFDEIVEDEQMHSTDIFATLDHPRLGRVRTVDNPIQGNDLPRVPTAPPPDLGQHSREILGDLGFDSAEIERLVSSGAVAASD